MLAQLWFSWFIDKAPSLPGSQKGLGPSENPGDTKLDQSENLVEKMCFFLILFSMTKEPGLSKCLVRTNEGERCALSISIYRPGPVGGPGGDGPCFRPGAALPRSYHWVKHTLVILKWELFQGSFATTRSKKKVVAHFNLEMEPGKGSSSHLCFTGKRKDWKIFCWEGVGRSWRKPIKPSVIRFTQNKQPYIKLT